jgi:adenine/guanine phosphoribosyltransferase-like PRPP-binding protein
MKQIEYKIIDRLNVSNHVRKERLVHELDGIEHTVTFNNIKSVGNTFIEKIQERNIDLSLVDYIIGMDSGGIMPTIALSSSTNIAYKLAWKLNLDIGNKTEFTETCASGKQVFLYNLIENSNIIIVDDEITTGSTVYNLYEALSQKGINVVCIISLFESVAFSQSSYYEKINCPVISLYKF